MFEVVYIIGEAGTRNFKIGKSNSVELANRLQCLQCGNPRKLYYEHIWEGYGFNLEITLHRELKQFRGIGEWFSGIRLSEVIELGDVIVDCIRTNTRYTPRKN